MSKKYKCMYLKCLGCTKILDGLLGDQCFMYRCEFCKLSYNICTHMEWEFDDFPCFLNIDNVPVNIIYWGYKKYDFIDLSHDADLFRVNFDIKHKNVNDIHRNDSGLLDNIIFAHFREKSIQLEDVIEKENMTFNESIELIKSMIWWDQSSVNDMIRAIDDLPKKLISIGAANISRKNVERVLLMVKDTMVYYGCKDDDLEKLDKKSLKFKKMLLLL